MTDNTLHPDHLKLISLAQAALKARDDRARWQANGTNAAEEHGAACEAVWDELERQVTIQDGRIPTIEHPTVRYRRMVAQMRGEIVAHLPERGVRGAGRPARWTIIGGPIR